MACYVKQISFVLVCVYALSGSQGKETNGERCYCVWDFLCVDGTQNLYGEGKLKPRSSSKSNCKEEMGLILCCSFDGKNITETSSTMEEKSTTPPSRENETDYAEEEAPIGFDQPLNNPTLSLDDGGFGRRVPNRPVPSGSVPSGSVKDGFIPGKSFSGTILPSVSSRPTPNESSTKSFPRKPSSNVLLPSVPFLNAFFPSASAPFQNAPYPSAPYPSAPYPSAPYPSAPYPSAPYPSAPYPSASYPGTPYPSTAYQSSSYHPKRPVKLFQESSEPKTLDPSDSQKESNQSTANTFVVDEDKPSPKANAFFVPKPGCGVKRSALKQRISFMSLDESIGGFAEFPWMLAVSTYENANSVKFQCGASLIHKEVALTAAHCVDRFPIKSLQIRAGEWNTKTVEEPEQHQNRRVRRVELHPLYRRSDLRHDIALIFLEAPYNTSRSVDTICLPGPDSIFDNVRCTVTGWGKDANNFTVAHHDILHKVDVPVIPHDECERRLTETRREPTFVHPSFLCAGGEVGKDACKGDGGGPLICPTDEENRWVQAGIVSAGYGCGTNEPAFYTDVSLHFHWIDRYLREIEHIPLDPHRSSNIHYTRQSARQLY